MIPLQIQYYTDKLQQDNYKSFYLALLRVGISLWLLKNVFINWPEMDLLYGRSAIVVPENNLLDWLPGGGISLIRNHYMWFIASYTAVIFLNIFGIGRQVTAVLLFLMVHVLQKMNMPFLNNGDRLARLILLYLIFANTYEYFVLVKQKLRDNDHHRLRNTVSNLAALSIMMQLCLAYFAAGVAKVTDPFWLHGEGTYYALSLERFTGTPFNTLILHNPWIDIISNYGVILFELFFPLLIWIKKLRRPLLLTGIIFHVSIYIFLMIYGFQIVFLLTYGLFLPNRAMISFAKKIKLTR